MLFSKYLLDSKYLLEYFQHQLLYDAVYFKKERVNRNILSVPQYFLLKKWGKLLGRITINYQKKKVNYFFLRSSI